MRDILDPADIWVGTPLGASVFGNKAPVVLDESLSVVKDSGPVSIAVLANDSDPEGGALTLVSAFAALGTAVAEANGTVTYTPPPGLTGFDSVVYDVADPLDQRRSGQVNITITEVVVPDLTMSVTVENTILIDAEGTVDITVTAPAAFAGSYTMSTDDLTGGPINLRAPVINGTLGVGNVLTTTGGLWVYETAASAPTQSWQWQRNGSDIAGATGSSYTVTASDVGQTLSVIETQADAAGQRSSTSPQLGEPFAPDVDAALIGWWDASDTGTITATAGAVTAWADKATGPALVLPGGPNPTTDSRTLNGLNVIDFNGLALLEASRTLPASGDLAIHMALVLDTTSNAFEAILAFEASNDMQIDAADAAQFNGRVNLAGVGGTFDLTGGPFSGALILSVIFDFTGSGTIEAFVGNVSRGSTGYGTRLDTNVALHLMSNRSKNAWVDGAVAELILTEDVTTRAAYHAYLGSKWGVA